MRRPAHVRRRTGRRRGRGDAPHGTIAWSLAQGWRGGRQHRPSADRTTSAFAEADLRGWLTYVASDELQGRQTYTEGIGLAGAYIARNLEQWGVAPAGDNGTYFQTVRVLGMRTRSNSSVDRHRQRGTPHVQGRRGRHLPAQPGRQADPLGPRRVRRPRRQLRAARPQRLRRARRRGKVVLYIGSRGPRGLHGEPQPPAQRARTPPTRSDGFGAGGSDRSRRSAATPPARPPGA